MPVYESLYHMPYPIVTYYLDLAIQLYEQENPDIDPKKFPLIGESKFTLSEPKSSEIRWVSKGGFTSALESMMLMQAILDGLNISYTQLQDQATVTDNKLPLNLLRAFEGKPPYYQRFGYTHPPFIDLTYLNDPTAATQSQSTRALSWASEFIKEEPIIGFIDDFKKAGLQATHINTLENALLRSTERPDQPAHILLGSLSETKRNSVSKALIKLTTAYLATPVRTLRNSGTSSQRILALSIIQHHAFMLKTREGAPKKRKRLYVTLFDTAIKRTQAYTWPDLAKEIRF